MTQPVLLAPPNDCCRRQFPRPRSMPLGTLAKCPECGRWWRSDYDVGDVAFSTRRWLPIRWYHRSSRRRIAEYERATRQSIPG